MQRLVGQYVMWQQRPSYQVDLAQERKPRGLLIDGGNAWGTCCTNSLQEYRLRGYRLNNKRWHILNRVSSIANANNELKIYKIYSPKEVNFSKRTSQAHALGCLTQDVFRESVSDFTRFSNQSSVLQWMSSYSLQSIISTLKYAVNKF